MEHQLTIAKAKKEDIDLVHSFVRQLEEYTSEISDGCYDEIGDWISKHLSPLISSAFRVALGCDILIDNCCDPNKDYLDFKPGMVQLSLGIPGLELIIKERERQIEKEGWTAEHDKQHENDELACAASLYAMPDRKRRFTFGNTATILRVIYPSVTWDWKWWKPAKDDSTEERIKELAKAGALIAAEIDRLKSLNK